ncbi:MAG: HD domain-containing protein [Gemmataceae bacterium]
MPDAKLRRAIAFEAARLMYERIESEYFTAKLKAAKRLCRGYVKNTDLPSNSEIRDLIQTFARTLEGEARTANLRGMRFAALALMHTLRRFRPRLIGSVLTGHVRQGSDIDLHVFADHPNAVVETLETEGRSCTVERKLVTKQGESRVFTHIHIEDRFPIELTVYEEKLCHFVFTSSITGKPIERASIAELEEFLVQEYPETTVAEELTAQSEAVDPYAIFRILLLPLDAVKQHPTWHPEGDALYHSLQVFEHAKSSHSYDDEFLQAALLHDVGKAIDSSDHVAAGVEAIQEFVSERTAWLVAEHMNAHEYCKGTLGARARKRLEAHPDFDDLLRLRECDVAGRVRGARVGTVDEALAFIRDVERQNRWK